MRKKSEGLLLPAGVLSAVTVGVLWTLVAGTFWQWLPIGAGVVVTLAVARAVHEGGDRASGKEIRRKKR